MQLASLAWIVQCYYRTFHTTRQPTDWNAGARHVTHSIHPRGFIQMKNEKGFTLIELMIVVAIIAILAAIAISQYQDYVIRSQVSEGSSLADGVKTAIGEFFNNYGRMPNGTGNDNTSLGLALPDSIIGTYVGSVGIHSGAVWAHYSSVAPFKANVAINTQVLLFTPSPQAGSMTWVCSAQGTGLKAKWLPSSCR
jgi:type IV pilus assembly protein PilA